MDIYHGSNSKSSNIEINDFPDQIDHKEWSYPVRGDLHVWSLTGLYLHKDLATIDNLAIANKYFMKKSNSVWYNIACNWVVLLFFNSYIVLSKLEQILAVSQNISTFLCSLS